MMTYVAYCSAAKHAVIINQQQQQQQWSSRTKTMQGRLRGDTRVAGQWWPWRRRGAVEGGDGVSWWGSSDRLPAARQQRRDEHRRQQDHDQLVSSATQIWRSVLAVKLYLETNPHYEAASETAAYDQWA